MKNNNPQPRKHKKQEHKGFMPADVSTLRISEQLGVQERWSKSSCS